MADNWRNELRAAAAACRAQVSGIERIAYRQHAMLVKTAMQAFGDDPGAVIFVETLPESRKFPRPDLILIHPQLGIVIVENKGIALEDIHTVSGHTLTINRDKGLTQEDPFHQAERVMYALLDLLKAKIDSTQALFNRMVALPVIDKQEFHERFGAPPWNEDVLFAADFASPSVFRDRVTGYCGAQRIAAGRPLFLTPAARDMARHILKGHGSLYVVRQLAIDASEAQLLGNQIYTLETSLKTLTPQQVDLMRRDVRGQHWLFRGVAGSGKSLLLASLAARLSVKWQDESANLFQPTPPPRILAVCYNRTLVHHLRGKILEEYRRLVWETDSPDVPVRVMHFHGLLSELSHIEIEESSDDSGDFTANRPKFAGRMIEALDRLDAPSLAPLQYDAIFLDEAQDLLPEEIQLLVRLARKDAQGKQTLVIFYDNAQNIYGVPAPVWESLGVNIKGRTTFMDRCMRNTRQTLELAFNVLVGSYAPAQTRVTTRTFADVANLRSRDLIIEHDDHFAVTFANRNGPDPVVRIFRSGKEEREFTINTIRRLWRDQKVLPSDILILYRSGSEFEQLKLDAIGLLAEQYSIRSVDKSNEAQKNLPLLQDRTMTFCTVHSAKGYDAPVVIILGADLFGEDTESRAAFYVAATRAKIALYVFGVKNDNRAAPLLEEIAAASRGLQGASSGEEP
jgi:superfamily I DNA and RNA helicase